MDQQAPTLPQQPMQQSLEDNTTVNQRSNKLKLVWGLICLLGPTAIIILAIFVYAMVNFISGSMSNPNSSDELFGNTSPIHSVMNVVLFLVGGLSVVVWFPGIIIGIILLATRKK